MQAITKENNTLGYISQSKGEFIPLSALPTPHLKNIANKTNDVEDLHIIIEELASRPRVADGRVWNQLENARLKSLREPTEDEQLIIDELIDNLDVSEALAELDLDDSYAQQVESYLTTGLNHFRYEN